MCDHECISGRELSEDRPSKWPIDSGSILIAQRSCQYVGRQLHAPPARVARTQMGRRIQREPPCSKRYCQLPGASAGRRVRRTPATCSMTAPPETAHRKRLQSRWIFPTSVGRRWDGREDVAADAAHATVDAGRALLPESATVRGRFPRHDAVALMKLQRARGLLRSPVVGWSSPKPQKTPGLRW